MRPCFAFSDSQAPEAPAKLSIYDEIGFWGVQAADFRTALSAVAGPSLDVEINSPGGDAFAGLAMYNMLRNSGKTVHVKIMGVAASAASLIAMAGDTISMPANTFMMVHNPYWCVQGNAADLRDSADALDKIQTSLTATYVGKTGMAEADMQALLSKDSWLTAAECLEQGFCTEVTADLFATAKFDTARAELPAHVKLALAAPEAAADTGLKVGDRIEATADHMTGMSGMQGTIAEVNNGKYFAVNFDTPMADSPNPHKWLAAGDLKTASAADKKDMSMHAPNAGDDVVRHLVAEAETDEIVAAATAAGFERHAPAWALACTSMAQVTERIDSANRITALCKVLSKVDVGVAAIVANRSIAEVRAALVLAMAKEDEDTHTDTTPLSSSQATRTTAKPAVTVKTAWASHNAQKRKT